MPRPGATDLGELLLGTGLGLREPFLTSSMELIESLPCVQPSPQLHQGAPQKHWLTRTYLSGCLWLCLTMTPCQCHPTLMLEKRSSLSGRARS